jgi:hypothetical protein
MVNNVGFFLVLRVFAKGTLFHPICSYYVLRVFLFCLPRRRKREVLWGWQLVEVDQDLPTCSLLMIHYYSTKLPRPIVKPLFIFSISMRQSRVNNLIEQRPLSFLLEIPH